MTTLDNLKPKMPEGPEVTVMTNCLRAHVEGALLTGIRVIKDSFHKKTKGFEELSEQLPQKIISVRNKGKFTYIELENKQFIGITYGMTGGIRLANTDKHNSVEFSYNDNQAIYYRSMRNFGCVQILTEAELATKLKKIGYFILDDYTYSPAEIIPRFRKQDQKNITVVLMNQSILSGIGNYIKSEILYRVSVNPNCCVSDLSDETLYELYQAARALAFEAMRYGGASLYTYTNEHGQETDFKSLLKVYNKKQDPDGNAIERLQTPDKRTTFWVPSRQL